MRQEGATQTNVTSLIAQKEAGLENMVVKRLIIGWGLTCGTNEEIFKPSCWSD